MAAGGGGGGAIFPVVFFDGEREMNIGDVRIHPAMEYKQFQAMLSHKIGISQNQISTYVVNRRSSARSLFPDDRRRVPITGKVDFGSICRQRECCFLVVLKRSRKSRNRREKLLNGVVEFAAPANVFSRAPVPENFVLLRRNRTTPFYDRFAPLDICHMNGRFRSWIEGYVDPDPTAYGLDFDLDPDLEVDSLSVLDQYRVDLKETNAFCEECWIARKKGGTASFHHCVNDQVVTRGTTRLGPINRPNNKPLNA